MTAPFVSVLVPTYNRAHLLDPALDSLLAQTYPHDAYEVVVVSDGSTDDTDAVLRRRLAARRPGDPELVFAPIPHGGLNTARNAALRTARGELLCFVDDDVLAPPGWLAALVAGYLAYPDAGAFGGPIRLDLERPAPRSCGREELGETVLDAGTEVCEPSVLYGSNLAVTRAAVELVGPFDVTLPSSGDEEEWLRRLRAAGRRVLYLPDAEVRHRRTAEDLRLRNLLRKRYARGRDQVTFDRKVGDPAPVAPEVRQVVASLAHAARERCALGLLPAAWGAGRLVGIWRTRKS
ncbi:MAG TPA: glycosyltransferase family A protein [Mycobacteriales bacterium]|nr:glycosyltransferase family A protein [Mycobacteriales bacterium]